MPIASDTTVPPGPSKRVVDSAKYINQHSQDVTVPMAGIEQAARQIQQRMSKQGYSTATWKTHPLNPSIANEQALEWIFLVDTLNFSFWTSQPLDKQYSVTFNGTTYRGYWTLCAAINRALNDGLDITDARVYAKITLQELESVFRTDDPRVQEPIPMLKERMLALHEVGQVLVDRFDGRFANLLAQCQGSAQKLVQTVIDCFPCFRDEHQYKDQKVCFYKRAQILVADIWACFEGQGPGQFHDIDQVTMFADYRVPQALYHFGVLSYSPKLLKFLENAQKHPQNTSSLLPSGHPWEIEIRGNSIWAVECIRNHIRETAGTSVNAILIDFYMWDYAKEHSEEMQDIPIHLTRSVFY
ncbi:hypothetical protein GGI07_003071 [Coemansia sp. Benny D115]|nr:hypothetical protein GGI07_003071 [Coemansia sp. Benny D115]